VDSFSFRDRQSIKNLNIEPSFKTREATSKCMGYVNTLLAKHQDDGAAFTHWNKIKDPPRGGFRFQSRILHNSPQQRGNKVQCVTPLHLRASKRENEAKVIKMKREREKERFNLISRNKSCHCESIDNRSHCGFKNGLQTDRHTDRRSDKILIYRLTDSILSV
jgi:hypothetical protein